MITMRLERLLLIVAVCRLFDLSAASDCIPLHKAEEHVGESTCVAGKVVRVKVSPTGAHFLDFCEDQMACPFTVVVFSHYLKDVSDVRRLAGRTIEIHGPVKLYDAAPRSSSAVSAKLAVAPR